MVAKSSCEGEAVQTVAVDVPCVLNVAGKPPGVQQVVGTKIVSFAEIKFPRGVAGNDNLARNGGNVRQSETGGVDHRPLLDFILDVFVLRFNTPF